MIMKNTCIVLGYGIFLPPNPEYQAYIEKALNICLQTKASSIIICGGYSNKDHPDISESSSIAKLFISLCPEIKQLIICEDRSLTTAQNIEFSRDRIKNTGQTPEKITIICDSIRVPKVLSLSLQLFSNILDFELSEEDRLNILQDIYLSQDPNLIRDVSFVYKSLEIKGIPLSQSPEIISYQIVSSMWEMHALDYPKLHQKFITWRKQKWGIK
jgi:hypothetical protein